MNSNSVGFIVGIAGAIVGATSTYFVIVKAPQNEIGSEQVQMEQVQMIELLERMNKTDAILHEIKIVLASNQEARQELVYTTLNEQPAKETNTDSVEAVFRDQETTDLPDAALEEAIVQNITTRFYDPVYVQSTTLAEVMQSEEMLELSDQARERIVVEMVGMLNRGEIDASTFLPNYQQNQ